MKITHETVQPMPHLPFKYYEHNPLAAISVAPHWHQGIELNYLVSGGTLRFTADGHTTQYEPGTLWGVNRRVVHSVDGNKDEPWDEFGLIIDDDFLQGQVPSSANWQLHLNGRSSQEKNHRAYATIATHMTAIRKLLHTATSDLIRLQIMSHFFAILAELGNHFATTSTSTSLSPNLNLVDNVMTYINENYTSNLSGSQLATQFHVSLTTLNQQFNASVQTSSNHYIRLVRLLNARRLLLNADDSIDYVASQCGFPNAKTFTRNFKDWKGLTPTEYRQSYAQGHKIETSCF